METGNTGLPTPYSQGYSSGRKGELYVNFYGYPYEKEEAEQFRLGWEHGSRIYMLRAARNVQYPKTQPGEL